MLKIKKSLLFALLLLAGYNRGYAQNTALWNNRQCAVVLTYDDALDTHLDHVIPVLDSLGLKATFYLIGSSPVIGKRLNEWRQAAKNGHELGNHALFHPCDGSLPGRSFVSPDHDLSKYTVTRAVEEIRINNTLLKAIDGKNRRTFAYPCGDLKIGDIYFYNELKSDFAGARGVNAGMQTAAQVNLDNIPCYMINGQSAEYMIDLVKKAQESHTLLVFLFHGVGGGHSINVDLAEHRKLLSYLKEHEKDIWIAPMVDVAEKLEDLPKHMVKAGPFDGAISKPLISGIYSADPSAHVFGGKIYIYPSHDIDAEMPENDNGDHFAMKDYHVFSMDSIGGKVTDHGVALDLKNIPWAKRQLWAPDIAYKNGKYYLYFPVKDKQDVFRIGVATAKRPEGPFKALPEPIKGSYSIDPAVFTDKDGKSYLYFGGIWGGQLQKWKRGLYDAAGSATDLNEDIAPALAAKVVKLSEDMTRFAEQPKDVVIVDEKGQVIKGGDHDKRFFEGAWMHMYHGKYYFSYSTGDTHQICYAIADNPYGPFTYQGVVLKPVVGWTTHHSIIEVKGKWFLFYHDTELSNGKTHLRNVKVTELKYDADGRIISIDPYGSKGR